MQPPRRTIDGAKRGAAARCVEINPEPIIAEVFVILTPSSRGYYEDNVASMAWGA